MSKTHGGSANKKKANPKLQNVAKVAAIAIDLGENAADPDDAKFIYASDLKDALSKLEINLPISISDFENNPIEAELKIRQQEDLLKDGMIEKIPALREQKNQKELLHKWHSSLTGNNVRVKSSLNALLESTKKNDFIKLLENVSNGLMNYSQPSNN